MTDHLAPIFLDNKPVDLQDPMPRLSEILTAGGKTSATDVKWLHVQPGSRDRSLRPEEVVDRTSTPNVPIYLTSGRATTNDAAGMSAKIPPIAAPIPVEGDSDEEKGEAVQGSDEPMPGGEDDQ